MSMAVNIHRVRVKRPRVTLVTLYRSELTQIRVNQVWAGRRCVWRLPRGRCSRRHCRRCRRHLAYWFFVSIRELLFRFDTRWRRSDRFARLICSRPILQRLVPRWRWWFSWSNCEQTSKIFTGIRIILIFKRIGHLNGRKRVYEKLLARIGMNRVLHLYYYFCNGIKIDFFQEKKY